MWRRGRVLDARLTPLGVRADVFLLDLGLVLDLGVDQPVRPLHLDGEVTLSVPPLAQELVIFGLRPVEAQLAVDTRAQGARLALADSWSHVALELVRAVVQEADVIRLQVRKWCYDFPSGCKGIYLFSTFSPRRPRSAALPSTATC